MVARSRGRKFTDFSRQAKRRTSQLFQSAAYPHGIHPGLVPGIGVESQRLRYQTDRGAMAITGTLIVGFIAWGVISTDSLSATSEAALDWVVHNTGWLFSALATSLIVYMVVLALSRYGRIPLGLDDEKPEFSFTSWVAMLFSAGMGIGLLFFGAYEPMTYFLAPPPGAKADPESYDALMAAMTQTLLHWGVGAWCFYALVGAAIAYNSYRRGREPLMSRIFTPLLGTRRVEGFAGRAIDMMAIVATLFGTAASLGMGALQIAQGLEITTPIGTISKAGIIIIISILTCGFIASAVSGVSRGIRYLSNINMVLAMSLAFFVFIVGPTVFIFNLIPSTLTNYIYQMPFLLSQSLSWGPDTGEFVQAWTVFYWAWWASWAPFVGMFIAKISRGRTLRQFIAVVLVIPTAVCLISFSIYGGTAMSFQINGTDIAGDGSPEQMFFTLMQALPLSSITMVVAMISIAIFFITSADSASLVMGTLSQQGKPVPDRKITVFWGLCLSGIAIVGLLVGGDSALQGLQNLIIVTALPFALIIIGMMVAFVRDLATDPMSIRYTYARAAIQHAVKDGLAAHGDDFELKVTRAKAGHGAGADFDSTASELTEWYQRTDEAGNKVDYDYATGEYLDEADS
ncbi:MAG: BCCT family transporter [Bowdeniella nasicola]|nr:BCCT family transporter [Bowdeniella nasicola]